MNHLPMYASIWRIFFFINMLISSDQGLKSSTNVVIYILFVNSRQVTYLISDKYELLNVFDFTDIICNILHEFYELRVTKMHHI